MPINPNLGWIVGRGWIILGGGGGGGAGGSGLESIHGGSIGAGFQEKGKYFINVCTVACRLKNFIFLLN